MPFINPGYVPGLCFIKHICPAAHIKTGMIQGRLARPLHNDDKQTL